MLGRAPQVRLNRHFAEMCSGSEMGSYFRLIHSWITHLKAQGLSMTCTESKEEEDTRFNTTKPYHRLSHPWFAPTPDPERLTSQDKPRSRIRAHDLVCLHRPPALPNCLVGHLMLLKLTEVHFCFETFHSRLLSWWCVFNEDPERQPRSKGKFLNQATMSLRRATHM